MYILPKNPLDTPDAYTLLYKSSMYPDCESDFNNRIFIDLDKNPEQFLFKESWRTIYKYTSECDFKIELDVFGDPCIKIYMRINGINFHAFSTLTNWKPKKYIDYIADMIGHTFTCKCTAWFCVCHVSPKPGVQFLTIGIDTPIYEIIKEKEKNEN
jgi:hypothetical protein